MSLKNARGELIVTTLSRPITSQVTGITSNGAGTRFSTFEHSYSKHAIQVIRTVGASAFTVTFEGGLIDGDYFVLMTHSGTSGDITFVVDMPILYGRYNVTDVGAGNTLTVRTASSD